MINHDYHSAQCVAQVIEEMRFDAVELTDHEFVDCCDSILEYLNESFDTTKSCECAHRWLAPSRLMCADLALVQYGDVVPDTRYRKPVKWLLESIISHPDGLFCGKCGELNNHYNNCGWIGCKFNSAHCKKCRDL